MNRRSFLRAFVGTAAAAAVIPPTLAGLGAHVPPGAGTVDRAVPARLSPTPRLLRVNLVMSHGEATVGVLQGSDDGLTWRDLATHRGAPLFIVEPRFHVVAT